MTTAENILSHLQVSKEALLNEVSLLLGKQQIAEYKMEVDYFKNKYHTTFAEFDEKFKKQATSYEIENDWLSWKFAEESLIYWQNLLG